MQSLYYFDNLIYKGNINRDFYLFCLKKNKSVFKYVFIHIIYAIFGFFSKNMKKKYLKTYHKYLNEMNDVAKLYKEFKTKYKKKINKWYLNNSNKNNVIIAKCPQLMAKMFLKNNNECIGFEFDENYELNFAKYEEFMKNQDIKFENIYYNSLYNIGDIKSDHNYCLILKKIIPINLKILKYLKKIGMILFILLLSFFLLMITFSSTTAPVDKSIVLSYFKDIKLILLNLIPIIFLMLITLFLTKKLWISYSLTTGLIILISIVNKTKLIYRDDILKFEDLVLLKEALIMTSRYKIIITWYIFASIILSIILILWMKNHIKKINLKYYKSFIIAILLVIISIFGYKKYYLDDNLYNAIGDKNLINIWIETRQFQIRGLLYPFIHSSKNFINTPPEGYDEAKAKKILSKYNYDDIPEEKKVNFISIMLEAYNDFSKFDTIEFTTDVYGKFNEIKKNSISGNLYVDIFGGGTIVTERQYITGYSVLPNFRKETYSYAKYFKEQGYVTEAMHPIYGAFYNRNTANLNMGFDNYWNYENKFSKLYSSFATDKLFYESIKENLIKTNKEGNKYFNFSVTYQNHGPYQTTESPKIFIKNKGYSAESFNRFNWYLNNIEQVNDAMYDLVDFIDRYEEPVVLVFFGDHNPSLGEANIGFEELGIDMSLNDLNSFKNYYSIPYIIHANNKAKKS